MLWIGLTGGLGTGKSTVANILRKNGIAVIDADRKAREVLEKGTEAYEQVVSFFGPQVLGPDQEIDRSQLARIVFQSQELKTQLEKITHPKIQEAVRADRNYLQDQGLRIAFYDVPLLFEKNLEDQFDATVLVYCPRSMQIERVKSRNQWTDQEILDRLNNQIDIEEKKLRAKYVINNMGSVADLESQVAHVLDKILEDLEPKDF